VDLELKPLFQQRLKHQAEIVFAGRAGRYRVDIKPGIGEQTVGLVRKLVDFMFDAVGVDDEHTQTHICAS